MRERNPIRFPLALAKRICPVCCKQHDGEIIMSMRGTHMKEGDHAVEQLHGKAIGFDEQPCEECKKAIGDKGAYLVGIKPELSDDMSNPYRSGHVVGVSWQFIDRVFDKEYSGFIRKNLWIFIEEEAMRKTGLIQ